MHVRVVEINTSCGFGSTGKLGFDLAQAAQSSGDDVLFAYSDSRFRPQKTTYRIGSALTHKIHAFESRLTGLQGYFSFFDTEKLLNRLTEFHPDVVHLHNLHGNYINLKLLLSYLADRNIKTVITLHDCWFFTGKCTYFLPANCTKWQTQCSRCPLLHKDNVNPTYIFDRTRKSFIDKKYLFSQIPSLIIVGVSEWISDQAKLSFFKNRPIQTIYNWVDQDIFYPREAPLKKDLGLPEKKIVLMVANRISIKKGYNELISMARLLPSDYQIVVIGDNPDRLSIPKNVIQIGKIQDPNHLASFYSAADVCVNTTKYETFGMVTIESMACGTPVVAYANTGTKELFSEGCGETIIDEGSSEKQVNQLVNSVIRVAANKGVLKKYCLNNVANRFCKEKNTLKYLNIYHE